MMNKEQLFQLIDERKQELFDILSDLIHYDSQNFIEYGNEEAIAKHIKDWVNDLGYEADMYSPLSIEGFEQHPDYNPNRGLENRYNVTAVIPGTSHEKRLMVTGHTDTVPIGRVEDWTVDPLGGLQKDGKIYGRGAGDDKSGIAVPMFLMKLLKDEGVELPYDLVFSAFCDEEIGGGNGALASCLKYPCDDILMLDGSQYNIWAGATGGGIVMMRVVCNHTCSCCEEMLDALPIIREEIDGYRKHRIEDFMALDYYKDTTVPETSVRYTDVRTGFSDEAMDRLEIRLTFYTTRSYEESKAEWDEIRERLDKKLAPMDMRVDFFDMVTRYFHFTESKKGKVLELLEKNIKEVAGLERKAGGSCLSDLPLFTIYGSPNALGFNIGSPYELPGGAHQKDEYVLCEELVHLAKIIGAIILEY